MSHVAVPKFVFSIFTMTSTPFPQSVRLFLFPGWGGGGWGGRGEGWGSLSELQKRADRAIQLVLFFLASANFWEKHAKNCAIMSIAHITYAIAQ